MRINFVLPYAGPNGGTRVVAIYAEILRRRGHDVVVISTPRRPPALKQRMKILLESKFSPSSAAANVPSYFDGIDVEHRIIDRYRPITERDVPDGDVVVATWWETASWIAHFTDAKGAKVYFMQDYGEAPGQPLDEIVQTWSLPLRIITISQFLLDLLQSHGIHDAILVSNGVDHDLFQAPARAKQPEPTVGYVYCNQPQKGCETIRRAIQIARQRHSNIKVVGFGVGRPKDPALLPENAQFQWSCEDAVLPSIYSQCDAWIFGSRREGFGLPILEAMACRTPVIATAAGAAPELLAHGGGRLIDPDDPQGMAAEIERICKMTTIEWQSLSQSAHETAIHNTWDRAADLFERVLIDSIERGSPNKPAIVYPQDG